MSNFFQLSDEEKQKISDAKLEVHTISKELFTLIGKQFEDTTELERQVIGTFCFGIIFAIIDSKELNDVQIYGITSSFLTDVLHYSEHQAEDFTEELINSTDEDYHPVRYQIIVRGMEGYSQYMNNQKVELGTNLREVIAILNKEV